MTTPYPIHALAVAAFIKKTPRYVILAARHDFRLVNLKFCQYSSQYSGFFIDHMGQMRPMLLDTSARSSSTISVMNYLRDGTELQAGVEILRMDLVEHGQRVRVVLSDHGVRQSILVPRHEVLWGVVTFKHDKEVEELFL